MTLTNTEALLALLLTAAVSALVASGVTVAAVMLFFQNLLASPAALKLVEGVVDSFPPQTRELIHVIAQFVETVSANGLPTPSNQTPPADTDKGQP